MTGFKFSVNMIAVGSLLTLLIACYSLPVQAGSTVIDGPGFKVEKKSGWFGRKKTVYQDALGNGVEQKTGWFGRTQTHTRLFGSEVDRKGKNVMVSGPDGQPLISKKKTLLHGEETHVDANGLMKSVQTLFK